MKYSEYFELSELSQKDLDFLDGLINRDTPLYIDPAQIGSKDGAWFTESTRVINSFFDRIFELYRAGNISEANALLVNGNEPNETRLGVSVDNPQGRGSSPEKLVEIFEQIVSEGLLQDGLILSHRDLTVFVKDFAEDRMSDLITNLIRQQLADYTVEQCKLHGIELTEKPIELGVSWDPDTMNWEKVYQQGLLVNERLLLLIPKSIVVKRYMFSVGEYLSRVVFEWRKQYHLENDTSLVTKKYVKKHDRVVASGPSHKAIKEEEISKHELSYKDYAVNMSREKRDLISEFRDKTNQILIGNFGNSLTDDDLNEVVEKRNRE